MSKQTRSKTLSGDDGYGTDDTESVPILSLVKTSRSKVKMEKIIEDKEVKDPKRYTTRSAASSNCSNESPVEKSSSTKYARSAAKRIPQNSYDDPIPHISQEDDHMGLSLGSLVKIPFKKSLKVDTKKGPKNDIMSDFNKKQSALLKKEQQLTAASLKKRQSALLKKDQQLRFTKKIFHVINLLLKKLILKQQKKI